MLSGHWSAISRLSCAGIVSTHVTIESTMEPRVAPEAVDFSSHKMLEVILSLQLKASSVLTYK